MLRRSLLIACLLLAPLAGVSSRAQLLSLFIDDLMEENGLPGLETPTDQDTPKKSA